MVRGDIRLSGLHATRIHLMRVEQMKTTSCSVGLAWTLLELRNYDSVLCTAQREQISAYDC